MNRTAAFLEAGALEQMSVGALAQHLAGQVSAGLSAATDRTWAGRAGDVVTVQEHYRRSRWVGADLDDDFNVAIRQDAEAAAAVGQQAVLDRLDAALDRLRVWPQTAPAVVSMPHWQWSMALDDFLLTRMMEMVVHADDLAAGIGVETPVFPAAVWQPVLGLLTSVAEEKHGQSALVRALTRSERAGSIAVF